MRQNWNFNRNFFINPGLDFLIVEETNLEQLVPFIIKGPYLIAPLSCCCFTYLKAELKLISSWIVRQYENEYNPPHFHGGHISGVGYLKLPSNFGETIQDVKRNNPNGAINFIHGSRQFLSEAVSTEYPIVGDFYIFPNYLIHSVNPFYGLGERRSVSFNAKIDDEIYNVYGL